MPRNIMAKKKKESNRKPVSHRKAKKLVKESKLFQNLKRTAVQFMSGKGYKPLSAEGLMQRLKLPEQHAALFLELLASLVAEGLLEQSPRGYIWKDTEAETV